VTLTANLNDVGTRLKQLRLTLVVGPDKTQQHLAGGRKQSGVGGGARSEAAGVGEGERDLPVHLALKRVLVDLANDS
jgi:hypothetical protein